MFKESEVVTYEPDPAVFDEIREDREQLRSTVESAADNSKSSVDADEDFEASREHLEELSRRYPGTVKDTMQRFLSFDDELRADPTKGAHTVSEFYLREAARFGREKPSDKQSHPFGWSETKLPGGATHVAVAGTLNDEIAKAMAQAERDKDWKAARELFAARNPGVKFSDALKSLLEFDAEAARNPLNATARLASLYGMPLTAEEQQQREYGQQVQASAAQELAAFRSDTMNYPRFDELRGLMADIFRSAEQGEALSLPEVYQHAAKIADNVAAFKQKHPDFPKVKAQMSKLLAAGKAKDLDDAYAQVTKPKPKPSLRDDLKAAFAQYRSAR